MSDSPDSSSARVATAESETILLARRAGSGDELATGRLLRLVAPRIGAVVRAVLGADHPDCDDALQLTLIAFVKALPAFRGECDPAGYASSIAVRTAVAARKRARVHASRQDEAPEVLSDEPSPSAIAQASRRKEILRDLLTSIPAEQAEALAMRVVLGWSLEEIATYSRAPLNTVRSRLRLAKEAMRQRIESDGRLLEELEVDP
jgi:RNA polymerase sigma factor (sigma-70 family)